MNSNLQTENFVTRKHSAVEVASQLPQAGSAMKKEMMHSSETSVTSQKMAIPVGAVCRGRPATSRDVCSSTAPDQPWRTSVQGSDEVLQAVSCACASDCTIRKLGSCFGKQASYECCHDFSDHRMLSD
jgi:hypothetical protein